MINFKKRSTYLSLVTGLVLVSVLIVSIDIQKPSLWLDEAYTWFFVKMPWIDMIGAVRIDGVNPPFYYAFTKIISDLFGNSSEFTLRLPSIIGHVLGLLSVLWLGYQIDGKIGSVAAGWFWAFNPMLIWMARDARPYALVAGLSALSLALFFRLQSNLDSSGSIPLFLGALLSISLGLLSHYFFLLFVGVTSILSIGYIRDHPRFFRAWSSISLVSFIPLLLWILWFLQLDNPSFGIGWIAQPTFWDPAFTILNLISGYGGVVSIHGILFGSIVITAVIVDASRKPAWPISTIFIPIVGVWLISQYRPVFVDRYFIVLIPFLSVSVARGTSALVEILKEKGNTVGRQLFPVGLGLLIIGILAGITVHTEAVYRKEDWKGLTNWLLATDAKRDILISEPELHLPLAYYAPSIEIGGVIGDSACSEGCTWIQRQPYTYTHALTQSIEDPFRSRWPNLPPSSCNPVDSFESQSGISAWILDCE